MCLVFQSIISRIIVFRGGEAETNMPLVGKYFTVSQESFELSSCNICNSRINSGGTSANWFRNNEPNPTPSSSQRCQAG